MITVNNIFCLIFSGFFIAAGFFLFEYVAAIVGLFVGWVLGKITALFDWAKGDKGNDGEG